MTRPTRLIPTALLCLAGFVCALFTCAASLFLLLYYRFSATPPPGAAELMSGDGDFHRELVAREMSL